MKVKQDAILNVYGNITNNPQQYHYWFWMNGTLKVGVDPDVPGADPGTIENTFGPSDLSQPGGIICTTDNVLIENGATIRNGKTHGIWLDNSDAVIRDSFVHDNGGDGIVSKSSSNPTLDNNEIVWNGRNGITVDNSNANITNNTIEYNTNGVFITNNTFNFNLDSIVIGSSANATVNYNNITSSGNLGIDNNVHGVIINAQNNWWGDLNGPNHPSNPNYPTIGDAISDFVRFDPWLIAPNP